MSVPAGTEAATDVPIGDAQKAVIDDAEKHTPPAVTPPAPPANDPADPSDSKDGVKELREQVGVLGQTVDTLAKAVEALVGGANSDESTASKLPLLLRGKTVRD